MLLKGNILHNCKHAPEQKTCNTNVVRQPLPRARMTYIERNIH